MTERQTHIATIALMEAAPVEVPVGTSFVVKLAVVCTAGCDLHASVLAVDVPAGAAATRQAPTAQAAAALTHEVALHAPPQTGDQAWRIALLQAQAPGVHHAAEPLSITVAVKPQTTSLAVWAIPSPVVMGQAFDIKAGAKSAGDFKLAGRAIEVRDEGGTLLAQGNLGDAPWPGTSGLYWTELRLQAPDAEGTGAWSVRFAAADVDLPHDGATTTFSVAVTRPADHRLTVKVLEKDTATPVEAAEVRLGVYRATTNAGGMAAIEVPKGTYELVVWKVGYDVPILSAEVTDDRTVELEATVVPEDDPDAAWQM
jgi:hypothetical protein